MVPHKIVSNVLRFKPALNLNRVLADFGGFKPRLKFFKFHLRILAFLFTLSYSLSNIYSLYSGYFYSFTLYLIHFPIYIHLIQDTCFPLHFILFPFLSNIYSLYSGYLHSFTLYLIHFPIYIHFIQDTCIPLHFIFIMWNCELWCFLQLCWQ